MPLESNFDEKAQLKESRNTARALLDASPVAAFLLDPFGVILGANEIGAKVLGKSVKEIIGLRMESLLPEDVYEIRKEKALEAIRGGKRIRYEDRHGGRCVENVVQPIVDDKGVVTQLAVFGRDVTEQKKWEEDRQRSIAELSLVNAIAQKVTATLSLDNVISYAQEQLMHAISPDLVISYLVEGKQLILSKSTADAQTLHHEAPEVKRIGECLCGIAVKEGKAVYSKDIFNDPRCTLDECKNAGIRSFAALPLEVEGNVIGVMGVGSLSERDFSEQVSLLEAVSRQVAIGVRNADLYAASQRHIIELEAHISERKRAERKLKDSEEKYSNLFHFSNDAIFVHDLDGNVLYVNQKALELFGYTESEILSRKIKGSSPLLAVTDRFG